MKHQQPKDPNPINSQATPATLSAVVPYRTMVDLASDAIVVSDARGRIVLVNRRAKRLFGYTRGALLGQPVEQLLPDRYHPVYQAAYLAVAQRTRMKGPRLKLWGRRSDGHEFPIAVSLTPLPRSGEPPGDDLLIMSTIRDRTRRRQVERAQATAEAASQELRQLQTIMDTALAHPRLDELLDALLERIHAVLAVDNVAILLLEEDGQRLRVHAASGPEREVVGNVHVPVGQGFAGTIAATRQPLRVDDLPNFRVVNPLLHRELRSVAGVPLLAGERLVGVLHIGSATPRHFTEDDVHLLQLVGERTALALDHARRAAAEQEAHAQAETLRLELEGILETMVDAVGLYNAQGQFVRANAAMRRLVGLDADPAYGMLQPAERARRTRMRYPDGRPVPPEEVGVTRLLRGEVRTSMDPWEVVITTLDGREIVLSITGAPLRDATGRIVGAVTTMRDVTELHRQAEQQRFQASMLERTHDAIFVWELGGPVVLWNRGAELLYGYRADEALGRRSRDLLRTRLPEPAEDFEAHLLDAGEWNGELTHTTRDGELVEVLSRLQVLRAHAAPSATLGVEPARELGEERVYVLETARDITERNRLARERAELLGLVAHDLGNPLAATKAQIQLLQRRLARGDTLPAGALDVSSQAISRMERLVGDLRVMEGVEAGGLVLQREAQDLAELCREEVDAVRLASGRAVTLTLPEAPVMVEMDRDRIGQVLANLLSNALKYSPADQPIVLTLACEPPHPATEAAAEAYARVSVRDWGPGIPPQVLPRVFGRFYRVPGIEVQHGANRGLGLGLYISRHLIERHGGQLDVDSKVGHGSTFWFTLPLAVPNAADAPERSECGSADRLRQAVQSDADA